MDEIKKLLLNQGKTATIEGVPPLTLERSLGKDLKDYKIYGKSQQGKNLLTYPYVHTTKTENGLTYTDNGDGSITIQGTATASSYFTINRGLDLGSEHITETVGTNGEYALSKKLRYNANIQAVSIEFKAGTVVDETFYPQAEKGTVSTEYEQPSYFVSPEKPIEIESVGDKTVNLADMSKTTNGNFVDNGDGSFTLTKISNSKRFSEEIYPNIPANTTFYIKAKILEYTGTYSQKLQMQVHLEDGSTKYINNALDDFQGKYTYTSAVKDIRIYSDGSNPDGTITTFKDLIISIEDVPYEPYNKYKIPVVSRGANLLDYRTFISRNQSLYPLIINDDGSLEYTGNYYITADGSFLKKGKTYVFDYKYESEINPLLRLQYADNTYTASFRVGNTVSVTKDVKFIMIYTDFTDVIHYLKIWDLMLVEGTTTKDYEPYIEPTKTNIFLNEPLRKVGDYEDYIDFQNKKVVRNIRAITVDSNNPCEKTGPNANNLNRFAYSIYNTGIIFDSYTTLNALCSIFYNYAQSFSSASKKNIFFPQYSPTGSATLYICVNSDEYPDVASIRALVDNKIKFYIPWGATEEDITLPNIPTHKGNTILELDTKINASNMLVKYKRR